MWVRPCPGLEGRHALDPRNTYAATKVTQEHLGRIWARETASRAISLRLHNVYGPGMPRDTPYAGVASLFSSALDHGRRRRRCSRTAGSVGTSSTSTTWPARSRRLWRMDDATGRRSGAHHAYNVGSGIVSTVGDLAHALSRSRNGPAPVVTGEYRLGDVRHITASSQKIHDELGWRATVSLADGVSGLTFG